MTNGVIKLSKNDPIITRAKGLPSSGVSSALTEVGFIPNDEYGCKIYASNRNGRLNIIGMHSKTYGCMKRPNTESVSIVE